MKKIALGAAAIATTAGLVAFSLNQSPQAGQNSTSPQTRTKLAASAGNSAANQIGPAEKGGGGFNFSLPGLPSANPYDGWVLEQTSDFAGGQQAYYCPSGARVDMKEMGVSMVVTLPDRKMAVFSDKRKICYRTTFDQYIQKKQQQKRAAANLGQALGEHDTPFQKGARGTIAGLSATQYISTCGPGKVDRVISNYDGSKPSGSATEIWFTEDLPVPAELSRLNMSKSVDGLPTRGVMLRLVTRTEEMSAKALDTVSYRKATLSPDLFKIPSGYKAAESDSAVLLGGDGGAAMEDFFKVMGQEGTKQDMSELFDEGEKNSTKLKQLKEKWGRGQ